MEKKWERGCALAVDPRGLCMHLKGHVIGVDTRFVIGNAFSVGP
jgi:hypothetical protein